MDIFKPLKPEEYSHPIQRLKDIMAILRSEKGCPWDKEQTHQSLIPCLLEETYEVVDTIEKEDYKHLKEELGDLLFQVVFHSQLAEEKGIFHLEDAIHEISEKLIRRHPHVFPPSTKEEKTIHIQTAQDVVNQWERIKEQEKQIKNQKIKSILDSVPKALPALQRAYKLQSKASKVGFDWKDWRGAAKKLWEEIHELQEELKKDEYQPTQGKDKQMLEEELGDVLFSIVNLARLLGLDPEICLRKTNEKFYKRFQYIESTAKEKGWEIESLSLEKMDSLWEEAKTLGKNVYPNG